MKFYKSLMVIVREYTGKALDEDQFNKHDKIFLNEGDLNTGGR